MNLQKNQIRQLSKEAGLFTWDKPSYACLATRIPAGIPITAQRLTRTEAAENYLMSLGFSDFRIRMIPAGDGHALDSSKDSARLQIKKSQLPLLIEKREQIILELKKDYQSVMLDLETRDE